MTLKNIMLAGAAAIALTGAASANTPTGFYLDFSAGGNWVSEMDTAPLFDFDTGYALAGSAGYKFDSNIRVEFEAGWRSNDYTYIRGIQGSTTALSAMVNVLYDFDLGEGYALSLGAGAGGARIGLEDTTFFDGRDYVFAYQGIAEFEALVSDDVGVFVGYNYLVADGFEIPVTTTTNFKEEYAAHTAYVGVRFHFLDEVVIVEPPPPPPPPAAKTFIVFFNFDRSDLTPEAQAVVAEAAAAYKSTGSVSISVVGHTDTVGSAAYNLPLSERRAASVKSGLVGNGIPADAITTSGRGFSEPLVPTGPGVKEPQNRRATIDLSGSAS
jgi:outer membrane protein OmpA-like peptidoglycan-associated protein